MNLVFRFLLMWIAAKFARRTDIMAETPIGFRCLPSDLDYNMHMTNSRYNSFLDISRINHFMRSGAWQKLRSRGLTPIMGSSSIRFRRPINPFQRFTVTSRLASWDDRWLYVEHRMLTATEVAALAIVKITFVGESGRVPSDDLMRIIGYDGPKPALTELHLAKDILDRALAA